MIVFIGVLAAILTALLQIRAQRRIAAQRATVDLISQREIHDPGMDDSWKALSKLSKVRKGHARKYVQDNPDERFLIFRLLNHYELVAASIHNGILDEPIYVAWSKTTIKRMWKQAQPLVVWVRAERAKRGENPRVVFEHLKKLVEETWKDQTASK